MMTAAELFHEGDLLGAGSRLWCLTRDLIELDTHEADGSGVEYMMAELDRQKLDEEIIAGLRAMIATYASVVEPQPGDIVVMKHPHKDKAVRAMIDGGNHYPGNLMVVVGARAYKEPEDTYVSASGGPCPHVHWSDLTLGGQTTAHFWRWERMDTPTGHVKIRGAGKGVDYTQRVNLWLHKSLDDLDRENWKDLTRYSTWKLETTSD